MSEQPKIPSNPISRTVPVFPRDYCTIDRAARILDCEIEDILQWGAEGAIPLMVNFDQWVEPVFGAVLDSKERHPDEDDIVNLDCARTWYEPVQEDDDIQADMEDIGDTTFVRFGGFWCVLKDDVYWNFLGHPLDTLCLFAPSKDFTPTGTTEVLARSLEFDNPFPTYWISRHSLARLKEHIESGVALAPDCMLANLVIQKTGKLHGNTVVNQKKRQAVIDAVNKLLKQGDVLHGLPSTKWYEEVLDLAHQLFEGGKCPFEARTVQNIIRESVQAGILPEV